MLNLLKYEFKKRKNSLIAAAIILAALEGLSLYLLNRQGEVFVIMIMGLMAVGVILFTLIDVIVQYYNDFKKTQGTLLFLTPNKGGKIVGSKMIFGAVQLIVGLAIVILFIYITNRVAVNIGYIGIGEQLKEGLSELRISFGTESTWWIITGFIGLVFLQYFSAQAVGIFSITIGRTVLSRNNYNWLWALLFFIGFNIVIETINASILLTVGLGEGWLKEIIMYGDIQEATVNVSKFFKIAGIEYIFWIMLSFFASSYLLNKRIDI